LKEELKYKIVNINTAAPRPAKSHILIIYTGGTFGMAKDERGVLVTFNFNQIIKRFPSLKYLDLKLTVISFPLPLDSSDITIQSWLDIGYIINENYMQYDGFIVLHGTDTMAYSASVLSFILDKVNKPIIFTGAQLPIGAIRTDAHANLITALEIASAKNGDEPVVPEVCVYFDYLLIRGNRAKKIRSSQFAAFESSNYPFLAKAGIAIDFNYSAIKKYEDGVHVEYHDKLDNNVASLKLFPGMSKANIESVFNIPGLRALILETFGSGNAPTNPYFLGIIKEAVDGGMIIYNVSQCSKGKVIHGRYKTSRKLAEYGVISGKDITFEAATAKMMYLLGNEKSVDDVKRKLSVNLRGEMEGELYK
jgi:L-asparaginase